MTARVDGPESAEGFEVEYVDPAGVRRRGPLSRLWSVRFEGGRPERRFPAFRGQGNWCGWYWSATCGGHVGYESWLERDHLMLLDFDPRLTAVASQPFQLSWSGGEWEEGAAHAGFLRTPRGRHGAGGGRAPG
ncbi:hypothetical protein [Streptomyces lunaelactis]|uniref:hypothetical protein n=1 Tax=Streptomyces lunaelactis TaxID=1535768 RepID=UPI0027B8E829|nr:hypothetical protein [Streptomyces lunaelactis]